MTTGRQLAIVTEIHHRQDAITALNIAAERCTAEEDREHYAHLIREEERAIARLSDEYTELRYA